VEAGEINVPLASRTEPSGKIVVPPAPTMVPFAFNRPTNEASPGPKLTARMVPSIGIIVPSSVVMTPGEVTVPMKGVPLEERNTLLLRFVLLFVAGLAAVTP